jgi:hypothetical protein
MDAQAVSLWLSDLLRVDGGPQESTFEDRPDLSPGDWETIVRLSKRHGLLPLLYHHLKAFGLASRVPGSVWQELRQAYRYNAARNATLGHALEEVLAGLESAGMPVIVLKGAHLAHVVYDSIALRSMGDVDLLVRRQDLLAVAERFSTLGYTPLQGTWQQAAALDVHSLPVFTRRNAPGFELHWHIVRLISPDRRMTTPFHIDLDGLWARAQPATIAGAPALVLSPEDLLLHLCVHLAEHNFRIGPRAYYDLAATIRHYGPDLDWALVERRARRWRAERCVYLALRLAVELLAAAVPEGLLQALRPDALDPHLVAWAREQTVTGPGPDLPQLHNLARVGQAAGLRDQVATFLRIVFPSPGALAAIYGLPPASRRVFLYYPVRLWDLVHKYGHVTWRLLRGEGEAVAAAGQEGRANALWEWLTSG